MDKKNIKANNESNIEELNYGNGFACFMAGIALFMTAYSIKFLYANVFGITNIPNYTKNFAIPALCYIGIFMFVAGIFVDVKVYLNNRK